MGSRLGKDSNPGTSLVIKRGTGKSMKIHENLYK